MKYTLPILFALGTALCWGLYGPTVANARSVAKEWSPFKPYVFIGVAYLVFACGGGLLGMRARGDTFSFAGTHSPAALWGFLAGSLGALGALSLTSSMLTFAGPPKPQLVMPIVFGGAVSITALVSLIQTKSAASASPWLWAGMALVVVGIVLVAYNTPHGGPAHSTPKPGAQESVESSTPAAAKPAKFPS
jgi:drug/metabolite transporter (DMT)-like permease